MKSLMRVKLILSIAKRNKQSLKKEENKPRKSDFIQFDIYYLHNHF